MRNRVARMRGGRKQFSSIRTEYLETRQLLAGVQIITPDPTAQTVSGSIAVVQVNYSTSDSDNTLTGVGLRVHYDSSKLTWAAPTGVLGTPMVLGSPVDDTSDYDGDAATDKYVLVAWADMAGNWPNVALPASLMTLHFGTASGFTGTTNVRFSASSTAAGYSFSSTPAAITAASPVPALSINDVSVAEGNSGTTNAIFTVTLSAASSQAVTVNYATADGTAALVDNDYQLRSGTLTFNAGVTSQTITVPVVGDTAVEPNETFYVNLSGASNATISDAQGIGTITNDDASAKLQSVTPEPADVAVDTGSLASFVVRYTTSDLDATLTGLGLRVHYDSSKLTWAAPTGVLGTPMVLGSPVDDASDYDGDAATDKYVLVAWADMAGNWPNTALPASLMTLNFVTASGFTGTTNVRFSASSTVAGYSFSSTPAAITAGDKDDPPTDIALSSTLVAENQPAGTLVGIISTTDPDVGDSFTYSLVGGTGSTDNASFTINGNQLKTAASFDFETKSSYSVRVRTTDQGGLTFEKVFTLTVTDVNEAPAISNFAKTLSQNGTLTLAASDFTARFTDPDAGNTVQKIKITSLPTHGTLKLGTTAVALNQEIAVGSIGTLSYTPNTGYTGSDSFGWNGSDGSLYAVSAATVSLTVNGSTTNHAPDTPTNSLPASGEMGVSLTPTLSASAFSDPDAGDTHLSSQWQVINSDTTLGYDSGEDTVHKTTFAIPAGVLAGSTAYTWQVRYKDNNGAWSNYSTATGFTTQAAGAPVLTITSPNGGEVWQAGNSYTINWVVSGDTSSIISQEVFLSTDGTMTYASIGSSLNPSVRSMTFTPAADQISSNVFVFVAAYDVNSNYAAWDITDGAFTIQNSVVTGPANDNFASATSITGTPATVTGTNVGATKEAGEPNHAGNSGGASVWWSWTAPSSGSVQIDTIGSDFDTTLGVYTGASVSALTLVANNDDSGADLTSMVTFDAVAGTTYRIAVDGFGGASGSVTLNVEPMSANAAPTDLSLSTTSVSEKQPAGTMVGNFSTTDADAGDTFTYSLVSGTGSLGNASFTIVGNQLQTATSLNYEAQSSYSIRVRTTDQGGLWIEKTFTIHVSDVTVTIGSFGLVTGKVKFLTIFDNGDLVTFKLTGGGTGILDDSGVITLAGTTAKSVLSVGVKNVGGGDGIYHLNGITSDGLLKSVNASAVTLAGQVRMNTMNYVAGKAAVSLKFRQISDADIEVQGLPVSAITVGGAVSESRISTTASIGKFSATALLDSDILVGVATDFAGQFAGHGDFTNPGAKLTSLKVAGQKVPKGSSSPAYVTGSHISAPTVGTVTLLNVAAGSDTVVYVMTDIGALKVSQSKLVNEPMFGSGTWKLAGVRPAIWEVV